MSGLWCRCISVKDVSPKAVTQEETYNGKRKKKVKHNPPPTAAAESRDKNAA